MLPSSFALSTCTSASSLLLEYAAPREESLQVLVTAPTNAAVDSLFCCFLRLLEEKGQEPGQNLIRWSRKGQKVPEEFREFTPYQADEVCRRLQSGGVLFVTCSAAGARCLGEISARYFSTLAKELSRLVIVDEGSQARLLDSVLPAVKATSQLVIFGNDYQINAVGKRDLEESLYRHLRESIEPRLLKV